MEEVHKSDVPLMSSPEPGHEVEKGASLFSPLCNPVSKEGPYSAKEASQPLPVLSNVGERVQRVHFSPREKEESGLLARRVQQGGLHLVPKPVLEAGPLRPLRHEHDPWEEGEQETVLVHGGEEGKDGGEEIGGEEAEKEGFLWIAAREEGRGKEGSVRLRGGHFLSPTFFFECHAPQV